MTADQCAVVVLLPRDILGYTEEHIGPNARALQASSAWMYVMHIRES